MDKIQKNPNAWYIGSAASAGFSVYTLVKQNEYVKEIKWIMKHPSLQNVNTNRKNIYDFIKLGIEYRDCSGMGNGGYKLLKWHVACVVTALISVGCLLRGLYLNKQS